MGVVVIVLVAAYVVTAFGAVVVGVAEPWDAVALVLGMVAVLLIGRASPSPEGEPR